MLSPTDPIAVLVPEFPGQTHVWVWREVQHLREWGVDVRMISTRPPTFETAARHKFAAEAAAETTYLWRGQATSLCTAVGWAALTRPAKLLRAGSLALSVEHMTLRERAVAFGLLGGACVLARQLVTQGVRHIHIHSAARAALVALMAQRLTDFGYSLTLHGNLDWWGGGMTSKLRAAEFVVVIADWLRDDLERRYPQVPSSRVFVASMGVDTRRWTVRQQERPERGFKIVSVGRLHAGKGHDVVIRAVKRLKDAGRDVHLIIVGGGQEFASLRALAAQLDLGNDVELPGSLGEDDVITLLRSADAFVLASHTEPLGVAYMEAMALGLPPIGTTVGGVGEVITDEHDGLLVPPDDPESVALAIARLMDDSVLRLRLATNARSTSVARFDSRIRAAKLYERLFGCPPRDNPDVQFRVGA